MVATTPGTVVRSLSPGFEPSQSSIAVKSAGCDGSSEVATIARPAPVTTVTAQVRPSTSVKSGSAVVDANPASQPTRVSGMKSARP